MIEDGAGIMGAVIGVDQLERLFHETQSGTGLAVVTRDILCRAIATFTGHLRAPSNGGQSIARLSSACH
jgi:hypothetical protein